jgi:hypothetical protein
MMHASAAHASHGVTLTEEVCVNRGMLDPGGLGMQAICTTHVQGPFNVRTQAAACWCVQQHFADVRLASDELCFHTCTPGILSLSCWNIASLNQMSYGQASTHSLWPRSDR